MTGSVVLYRGPSRLDGAPIVVVATRRSRNPKTGDVVGTWILPDPDAAPASRPHPSVCGSCPLAGIGACYVNWSTAPLAVQRSAAARGPVLSPAAIRAVGRGRFIRLGQAGDPAAVPAAVWRALLADSVGHTGYTHAWRDGRFRWLQRYAMASVESAAQAAEAQARGWRTFRIRPTDEARAIAGEIDCPSARGVTCNACGLCSGTTGRAPHLSISIRAHGGAVAARQADRYVRSLRETT
jgi:hypothetical protein